MVELEACVLNVRDGFIILASSRVFRLPSLVEDSVAADICLEVSPPDLIVFLTSVDEEISSVSRTFFVLETPELLP